MFKELQDIQKHQREGCVPMTADKDTDPTPTCHTPEVVKERREQAAAINAVMNPTPAGKLSDEQLGVIGLRAANSCNHQVKFYENFARAVREAVEKECNRSMQNGLYQAIVNKLKPILGENSRELEWDILPFTLGKLIAAKRIPDAGQAKKIGEQAEEIARLTAELEACDQARKNACDDRDAARAELAKANAELERMQWRPVSVKPTRGDADEGGFVTVLRADKLTAIVQWDANGFNPDFDWRQISQALRYTKWRAAALPPSPSAEEVERKRFEKWYQDYKAIKSPKGLAFDAWQARASKETTPPTTK